MPRTQRCSFTKSELEFAKNHQHRLAALFPFATETVLATCRFRVQGPWAQGNWGFGVRTRLQSYGHSPDLKGVTWQNNRNGAISADSIPAADSILECFGITMLDIVGYFGNPQQGEQYEVSLAEVVNVFSNRLETAVA